MERTNQNIVVERRNDLRQSYRIGKVLGQGGFGQVRKIMDRTTGEIKAMKVINKLALRQNGDTKMFFNEVSTLQTLSHPNILHLYEIIETEKTLLLVTEHLEKG